MIRDVAGPLLSTLVVAAIVLGFGYVSGRMASRAELERLTSLPYAPPPDGMVLVPAGEFYMGSDKDGVGDEDEFPKRSHFLKAFYIDIYEVTNAQYAHFDPSHRFPPDRTEWPVTGISKESAQAYAESLGKRLPTAAEWEKAARGTDGRTYPWGNDYRDGYANLGGEDLAPVGSFPKGVSPYGAHDMAGNAWEWTSDVHRDTHVFDKAVIERNIIKGGGYSYNPFQGRSAYKGFESIGATCNDLGFRCAMDAIPAKD